MEGLKDPRFPGNFVPTAMGRVPPGGHARVWLVWYPLSRWGDAPESECAGPARRTRRRSSKACAQTQPEQIREASCCYAADPQYAAAPRHVPPAMPTDAAVTRIASLLAFFNLGNISGFELGARDGEVQPRAGRARSPMSNGGELEARRGLTNRTLSLTRWLSPLQLVALNHRSDGLHDPPIGYWGLVAV